MADHPLKEFSTLLEAMAEGDLVLTPNHRTYVQLLDFYGQWRRQNKLSLICKTPEVYPVDIWIRKQWQNCPPSPAEPRHKILEPVLESSVWQRIIMQSDYGESLVNKSATARTVQEAWRLIHVWKIKLADIHKLNHFQVSALDSISPDDLGAFLLWVESFENFCQQHFLISLSPLLEKVIEKIASKKIHIPGKVVVAGFQSPPPLYLDLINTLEQHAEMTTHFSVPPYAPEAQFFACTNSEDEIDKAARWARQTLAQNPQAKIGIINLQLQQQASALKRIFQAQFNADAIYSLNSPDNSKAFALSLQQPLQEQPVIDTALGILELNRHWLDTLSFCKLLRSPFLAVSFQEESAIAALEYTLRDKGELKIQLSLVRQLCSREEKAEYSHLLSSSLLALDSLRRQLPAKAHCLQWSDLFEEQLKCLGWPGTRDPDHHEREHLQSWSKALRLFKQTSHWHGSIDIESALSHLKQIVGSLSVGTGNDMAPVQLISPTEADGLIFTHTWIMGLSEQNWPAAVRPSPFIPLSLQKKARIPESDASLLTALASHQLQQFRDDTTTQIVYSYACQDDDLTLKPTAMLASLCGNQLTAPARQTTAVLPDLALTMLDSQSTVILSDEPSVPLLDDENNSGGVSLIANQADCPFKAFALHRLGASPLPAPVVGLPASVLGSLLHEVMERFWSGMKDQQQLLQAGEEAINTLVAKTVGEALQDKARHYRYTMTERFIALEGRRLSALLVSWLEEEKKRGSFTVLDSETRLQWKHASLILNIRIDRLDQTPAGKLVVVDYKSSKNSEIKWLDERQTAPQLMLYMQAVEANNVEKVDAMFIAQINIEESRYKGISNDDSIYPKSLYSSKSGITEETSWDNLRLAWQESLAGIANQYLQGFVAVDPKKVASSCTWCHLGGFCRINEEIQK